MEDIDYAALYGVHPGESDFSGAIERSSKNGPKHFDEIMMESIKFIKAYREKHPRTNNKLHKETNKLLLEYNKRLRDDENFPNKDEVRDWFYTESNKLIEQGAPSFSFLYPEFMGPMEILEKIYSIVE